MRQTAAAVRDEEEVVAIWREHDAKRLNAILNDPAVRADVADAAEGRLDCSSQAENPNNYLLAGAHGACLFFYLSPGIYEVHSQVVAAGRGRWMAEFAALAVQWMFTRSPAWEITTRVPVGHIAAKALTIKTGFRLEFTRPDQCRFRGAAVPVEIYRLSIHDWVEGSAWAESAGRRFHTQLEAEARRIGVKDPQHADDPQHNRIAGAAVEMARYDQVVKAVLAYDRWAFIARHAPITLVSQRPPVVKMDIGKLEILPRGIKVTRC